MKLSQDFRDFLTLLNKHSVEYILSASGLSVSKPTTSRPMTRLSNWGTNRTESTFSLPLKGLSSTLATNVDW